MNKSEIKPKRDSTNRKIVVRITYQTNELGNIIDKEDNLYLYNREDLESSYKRFKIRYNLKKDEDNNNKNFYVKRENNYILLEKNKKIGNLGLKSGDHILISPIKREERPTINKNDVNNNIIYHNKKVSKIKKCGGLQIILIIIVALIILTLGIIFPIIYIRKKKKTKEIEYEDEKLATKINYVENIIYRYKSNKHIKLSIEAKNISSNNSEQNLIQYIDFIFIIRKSLIEIENNQTKKNWYSGYIGILNMTIFNGTKDMMIFYDKDLNKYINIYFPNNSNNELNENIVLNYTNENDTSCFI